MESIQERGSAGDALIRIEGLAFKYLNASNFVLNGIDLSISQGEVVLIAGHSGSGKSTLLRAINGLIPHQHSGDFRGDVVIDGLSIPDTPMGEIAKKVGYVFQNPENQIFMFSVERDVAFGLENLQIPQEEIRARVDWALQLLRIQDLALRAPHELSDGQKQRVAIAGVIAMRPKVLILDEPTSLLDPFTAREVISLVMELHARLGITILIVEHRLDLIARLATRMMVLERGKVAFDGNPRAILSQVDISKYGVTEPTIVRLAKLLGKSGENLPMDATALAEAVRAQTSRYRDFGS